MSDGFDKRPFFGVIPRIHLGESSENGGRQRNCGKDYHENKKKDVPGTSDFCLFYLK